MRKKIMFVLQNAEGGGAERAVINSIKSLDRNKFTPILFLFFKHGEYLTDIPEDVQIVHVFEEKKNMFLRMHIILFNLIKSIRKQNVDIVVGSLELWVTYITVAAGKICNKITIGWIHTNLGSYFRQMHYVKKNIHKLLVFKLYPCLDKIITVSNDSKEYIRDFFKNSKIKNNIIAIYNPVFTEEIIKKSMEKNSFCADKPLIIGIGRLIALKRFDLLIHAHKILLKQGIDNKLLILGEGQERKNLEKLIMDLNVADSVELLGFQSNPYSFLKKADVFVLSSDCEGLPTVLIESLILGIPSVATNCTGGIKEILNSDCIGNIVPINDSEAIASAVQSLLSNKKLAKEYSENGKKRAEEFDKDVIKLKFEKLFEEL